MAVIGTSLAADTLVLTKGRDFRWSFENLDASGLPVAYPAGQLYFELATSPVTQWQFTIAGSVASLKVESTAVDLIPDRTKWQLVFLAAGEASGGDPVGRGTVKVQV